MSREAQRAAVWSIMADESWHSLADISRATRHPEASVSARLRDFRKQRYGAHKVERLRMSDGRFMYRLRPRPSVILHGTL